MQNNNNNIKFERLQITATLNTLIISSETNELKSIEFFKAFYNLKKNDTDLEDYLINKIKTIKNDNIKSRLTKVVTTSKSYKKLRLKINFDNLYYNTIENIVSTIDNIDNRDNQKELIKEIKEINKKSHNDKTINLNKEVKKLLSSKRKVKEVKKLLSSKRKVKEINTLDNIKKELTALSKKELIALDALIQGRLNIMA